MILVRFDGSSTISYTYPTKTFDKKTSISLGRSCLPPPFTTGLHGQVNTRRKEILPGGSPANESLQRLDIFFSKIQRYIPDSLLSRFPFGDSECTQWQDKHQRCSRNCRVQKNCKLFTVLKTNQNIVMAEIIHRPI